MAGLPQIGVVFKDKPLTLWLTGALNTRFVLQFDPLMEPDPRLIAIYLFDLDAAQSHRDWLQAFRETMQPDSAPILLVQDREQVVDEELSGLFDALIYTDQSVAEICEQLLHWIKLQNSAHLWTLAAQGASGHPVHSETNLLSEVVAAPLFDDAKGLPSKHRMAILCRLLNASSQGMFVCDSHGAIRLVNSALCNLTGFQRAELIGHSAQKLLPHFAHGGSFGDFRARIRDWGGWEGELCGCTKQGSQFPVWLWLQSVSPLLDEPADTDPGFYVGLVTDLTSSRHLEACVLQLSRTGSLSEINRILFEERLAEDIKQADISGKHVAVLNVELRDFRSLNEQYGYVVGDWVLMAQLQRLQGIIAGQGLVARLHAEHYAVIMPGLSEASDIAMLANDIVAQLSEPLEYEQYEFRTPTMVGYAFYPEHGCNAQELMKNADAAVDWCRLNAPAMVKPYSPDLAQWLQYKTERLDSLRRAVTDGSLRLVYQPQIDIHNGDVIGVEALIRWHQPDGSVISPKDFIPLAEEHGLIVAISHWVLNTACQQLALWQAQGLALTMAVNISAMHFQQGSLVNDIRQCLAASGIAPEFLELEVTESCLMTDSETAAGILRELKELGVKLAMDDFGTGYSSLSYLRLFPLDKLKIDQSFVREITHRDSDAMIVRAIIALGHAMGLKIIAEGIETAEQNEYLKALTCDLGQGFYFGRPVDAADLPALLVTARHVAIQLTDLQHQYLLLVDDEWPILNALKRTLRPEGYHILQANSASEALEMLARHPIGVIVCDNRMPGMTGIELLRQMKTRYPQISRIMLSGYTDLTSLSSAVNAGEILRFLTKPWDDQELKAAIQEGFARYQSQKQMNQGTL